MMTAKVAAALRVPPAAPLRAISIQGRALAVHELSLDEWRVVLPYVEALNKGLSALGPLAWRWAALHVALALLFGNEPLPTPAELLAMPITEFQKLGRELMRQADLLPLRYGKVRGHG
jgi:hypothetical protein